MQHPIEIPFLYPWLLGQDHGNFADPHRDSAPRRTPCVTVCKRLAAASAEYLKGVKEIFVDGVFTTTDFFLHMLLAESVAATTISKQSASPAVCAHPTISQYIYFYRFRKVPAYKNTTHVHIIIKNT